jgi:glutamyl/glutaminyl-tRNA synthetase
VTPLMISAGLIDDSTIAARREWYMSLLDLLRVRARTTDDIIRQARPYLLRTIAYDPDAAAKNWKDPGAAADILEATAAALESAPDWTPEVLESTLRALAESKEVAAGKIFQPLRVALTGMSVSPGIFEVLVMQGRDMSISRIRDAVAFLRKAPV